MDLEVVFINSQVSEEYGRWYTQLYSSDRYDTPETVGIMDVLRAHFLIVDFFDGQESGLGKL
jgi:hypothetical protein